MKLILTTFIFTIFLSGCGNSEDSKIDSIWKSYINLPGNAGQGVSYIDVKGEMIKQGTVSPSALNTSAKERLPAYLACYTYVAIYSGMGDIDEEICIYHIDNPTRKTHTVRWRGKEHMSVLESWLAEDDFKPTLSKK